MQDKTNGSIQEALASISDATKLDAVAHMMRVPSEILFSILVMQTTVGDEVTALLDELRNR